MDEKYFAQKIEQKWQRRWAENKTFEVEADDAREKFYCLEMLPYPSGRLHMGHVRNYSIGDALAWYKRLQGFNVLHPIGWDSFGQPAEQAAIKKGVNPREWTEDNINQMREQLQQLGIGYDWRREIAAHRPEYYKFDQWFFLKMLERGLAYKKMTKVNWCPKDQTTLSNEQASGGVCWRCGTAVEKKDLAQWFLRITAYAEELLQGMNGIEAGWAERVLAMQKNWIGKSEGAYIDFAVKDTDEQIRVFTTRIDTIYGANAIVVAVEHPIIETHRAELSQAVADKIEEIKIEKAKPTDYGEEVEKDGIDTGLKAINPFSGEELPVWVGNYVMMEYGTGAVMSVPAHDERDFEFANKFGLPIKEVVRGRRSEVGEESEIRNPKSEIEQAFTDYGVLVNSGEWSGKTTEEAKREMAEFAEKNNFGEAATTYRLRDWGISRQRFWGAPIPIIYCEHCGAVPERYENLPVELPETAPFTGVGESPLAKVPEFYETTCPQCDEPAKRETDTMDTFVDSTWYYFRYTDAHNSEMPFKPEIANYWLPVDQYIGGVDHAVMHLLYTRFWTKVMRDIGLIDFDEPVENLLTQGMVVGESFYSKSKESYVPQDEVLITRDDKGKVLEAILKNDASPVKVAVEKMSKSKYNGVDPDEMINGSGLGDGYGADATRLFVLFAAPAENELVWKEEGVEGTKRFLQKVWRFVYRWQEKLKSSPPGEPLEFSQEARKLRQKTHQTIKRITENFESFQFNTPVAALMELSNSLADFKIEPEAASDGDSFAVDEAIRSLILMLAPYAPHVAEELWEILTGSEKGILQSGARFPIADESLAKADEIEIPIQVNGKLRSRVLAAPETSREELEAAALANEKVKEYTDGKQIVKIIVVPNRLVNIVIK
ncbi:MAG: leucine--tRNA ligase [Acidobacteriota bacterium]|nr:leucine--tRNA ligase [Acidobacteriota bacterium]